MTILKKLRKAEAEVMVYVRKLLGGESSSVACGWADKGVEDGGSFSICLSDSQQSTHRTSFEWVAQENMQGDRTDAAVDAASLHVYVYESTAWVRVSVHVCSQEAVSQGWHIIGQIKADSGY